jgi:DNA-binding transcriptional ArsR family regulator
MVNRMVKYSSESLDATFAALADPTRRSITARLSQGPASVSELAAPFAVSLPAVTKHLSVLEHAGLIEHWKEGRTRYCRLNTEPLERAEAWVAQHRIFWQERFQGLHDHLRKEHGHGEDG